MIFFFEILIYMVYSTYANSHEHMDHVVTSPNCSQPFDGGPHLRDVCTPNVAGFLTNLDLMMESSPTIGDPCGRVKPTEKPMSSYDFIVIGSGAAGAAVAGRLSEIPEWRILLLEAGPDEPAGTDIPANFRAYLGTDIDWKYMTTNESYACQMTNGSCYWPRGRNLGGTTTLHGMTYHRGNARDYANWVAMGNDGWSYSDVLPFFKKSEDNREIPRVSALYHGTGGPMTVETFPYHPLFAHTVLKAAVETGYGITEDMVGSDILGFTIAQTMSRNGVRQSSASAFLRPIRDRENIDIAVNATATKIVVLNNTVQAVEYIINGEMRSSQVRREVVVSGGTVNSPQLLLLSGIGPAGELAKVGIPVVLDLPGVGENLHNHVSYGILYTLPERSLTNYRYQDVKQYLVNQTGPLSSTGMAQVTGMVASKYTTADDPDMQIFFGGLQESCQFNSATGSESHPDNIIISLAAVNIHPKSRGRISLASKDPLKYPIIWGNDLSNSRDVEVLIEGIHVLRNIANSSILQSAGLKLASRPVNVCSQYEFLSDDYFRCAVRYDSRTENHQAGSCKMGPSTDPMAVVDPQLRVHGITGLRVADASIMPQVISGNPHATITMIGERAADFIKKEYNKY